MPLQNHFWTQCGLCSHCTWACVEEMSIASWLMAFWSQKKTTVKDTTDGKMYVELSQDTCTRAFQTKMWSTPENPDQCRVWLFELYVSKRPQWLLQSWFSIYLAINYKVKPGEHWYKRQRLGVNRLAISWRSWRVKQVYKGTKAITLLVRLVLQL